MEVVERLRAALTAVQPLLTARHDLLIAAGALIAACVVLYLLFDTLSYAAIPSLEVPLKQEELADVLDTPKYTPPKSLPKEKIPCYDPGTMQLLGYAKAMTPEEVRRQPAARGARAPSLMAQPPCANAPLACPGPRGHSAPPPFNWACRRDHITGACHHCQGEGGLQGEGSWHAAVTGLTGLDRGPRASLAP
jgi:hypothetical protein